MPYDVCQLSRFIALFLLCAYTTPLRADVPSQFFDPLDGQFDVSEYLAENAFGFLPVPVIITEPAVDGGLGMVGMFFHEDDESAARRKEAMRHGDNPTMHLIPPSVSAVMGAYTGNGSWFVGGGHMGFFNEGRIRYRAGGGYGDVDLDYYSLGNVELQKPLSINTQAYSIMQTLSFRVGDLPLFIGPMQRYTSAELSPGRDVKDSLPPWLPPAIGDELQDLLTSDISTSGLGVDLQWDTRNNIFTPTEGFYYNLSAVAYRDAVGSDIDYEWYKLDGLNYFRFSPQWRGGLRIAAELADADGKLPPFAMPGIDLRGIPAARYQGTHVGLLEAELTWELNKRWSFLGFAGAGRASNSGSDFGSASTRVNKGLGFRYQIARRYGFHVGLDVARGPEDTVWYIQAGSAW